MARNTLAMYGSVSLILCLWAVNNAYSQFSNFFAAIVYLDKSQFCRLIVWNFAGFIILASARFLQAVFLGRLSSIEMERMQERIWYTLTETLLALTVFRTEVNATFLALFATLILLKVFHWILNDRVEFMDSQPPGYSQLIFHSRVVGLLLTLWVLDISLTAHSVMSILEKKSVMVMFASECIHLLTQVLGTSIRYGLNVAEPFVAPRGQPWTNKSLYIFYAELLVDFLRLISFTVFFFLTLFYFALPLNMIRDVFVTLRSFVIKCRDLVRLKRATRNMDERYPSATRTELEAMSDRTCIICREDLEIVDTNGDAVLQDVFLPQVPKKLPCGHIFHFQCLRSWLERQQSCPTCRRSVIDDAPPRDQPNPQRANNAPRQAPPNPRAAPLSHEDAANPPLSWFALNPSRSTDNPLLNFASLNVEPPSKPPVDSSHLQDRVQDLEEKVSLLMEIADMQAIS